jgi:hypothetical protein
MSNKKLEIVLDFLVKQKSNNSQVEGLQWQSLMQQIRLQNVMKNGEHRRRLAQAQVDIWYEPVLAQSDYII